MELFLLDFMGKLVNMNITYSYLFNTNVILLRWDNELSFALKDVNIHFKFNG